jgi:hypothetical protein
MPTVTRNRNQRQQQSSTAKATKGSTAWLAVVATMEATIYGVGSPLYKLLKQFGKVSPINTLAKAFTSFAEAKAKLQEGECGYSVSDFEGRKAYSLAAKVNGGIMYCGLHHDADGNPETEADLEVVQLEALREFELEGEVIISTGDQFMKAVPAAYVAKLKKA